MKKLTYSIFLVIILKIVNTYSQGNYFSVDYQKNMDAKGELREEFRGENLFTIIFDLGNGKILIRDNNTREFHFLDAIGLKEPDSAIEKWEAEKKESWYAEYNSDILLAVMDFTKDKNYEISFNYKDGSVTTYHAAHFEVLTNKQVWDYYIKLYE